ncbi:MAG TPA: ABC-2 family transporter protein [Gaiellaceae bacterium]|nr:ABC-2 family transporter protein [Gaiellaceae bacterium]
MTTLRVALLHLRIGVMKDLQYRVNFALQVLQSLLAIAVGLIVFQLVFSHTTELNGWTHSELLAVLGVQAVMAGVIHALIQPNMMRLTDEVREGKLDYALTKPVDAQMLVSVREVQLLQAVDVITGAAIIVVALAQLGGNIGVLDALAFAVALLFGAILLYCFWLVLATGSFWVVRMWFLPELFEGIFQTGRWPIGIYPDWLRFGITFLVPIAFAITVPAEAVTSRLDWKTLLFAAVFTVFAFAVTRWFWRFGLRHYTGASA